MYDDDSWPDYGTYAEIGGVWYTSYGGHFVPVETASAASHFGCFLANLRAVTELWAWTDMVTDDPLRRYDRASGSHGCTPRCMENPCPRRYAK